MAGIVLGLFLFSCVADTGVAAEKSLGKEKKVKWVKSKYGLKALIDLAAGRGEMVKEYRKETINYDKVKKAIEGNNVLKDGEEAFHLKKRYGEPVVILSGDRTTPTKWVYKPAHATFFSGEKAYLIFDENEKLIDWKLLQQVE